jgi:hypothetical protein
MENARIGAIPLEMPLQKVFSRGFCRVNQPRRDHHLLPHRRRVRQRSL